MPKEHEDDFKSVKKFNVFNTNNLWIRLITLMFKHYVDEDTLCWVKRI